MKARCYIVAAFIAIVTITVPSCAAELELDDTDGLTADIEADLNRDRNLRDVMADALCNEGMPCPSKSAQRDDDSDTDKRAKVKSHIKERSPSCGQGGNCQSTPPQTDQGSMSLDTAFQNVAGQLKNLLDLGSQMQNKEQGSRAFPPQKQGAQQYPQNQGAQGSQQDQVFQGSPHAPNFHISDQPAQGYQVPSPNQGFQISQQGPGLQIPSQQDQGMQISPQAQGFQSAIGPGDNSVNLNGDIGDSTMINIQESRQKIKDLENQVQGLQNSLHVKRNTDEDGDVNNDNIQDTLVKEVQSKLRQIRALKKSMGDLNEINSQDNKLLDVPTEGTSVSEGNTRQGRDTEDGFWVKHLIRNIRDLANGVARLQSEGYHYLRNRGDFTGETDDQGQNSAIHKHRVVKKDLSYESEYRDLNDIKKLLGELSVVANRYIDQKAKKRSTRSIHNLPSREKKWIRTIYNRYYDDASTDVEKPRYKKMSHDRPSMPHSKLGKQFVSRNNYYDSAGPSDSNNNHVGTYNTNFKKLKKMDTGGYQSKANYVHDHYEPDNAYYEKMHQDYDEYLRPESRDMDPRYRNQQTRMSNPANNMYTYNRARFDKPKRVHDSFDNYDDVNGIGDSYRYEGKRGTDDNSMDGDDYQDMEEFRAGEDGMMPNYHGEKRMTDEDSMSDTFGDEDTRGDTEEDQEGHMKDNYNNEALRKTDFSNEMELRKNYFHLPQYKRSNDRQYVLAGNENRQSEQEDEHSEHTAQQKQNGEYFPKKTTMDKKLHKSMGDPNDDKRQTIDADENYNGMKKFQKHFHSPNNRIYEGYRSGSDVQSVTERRRKKKKKKKHLIQMIDPDVDEDDSRSKSDDFDSLYAKLIRRIKRDTNQEKSAAEDFANTNDPAINRIQDDKAAASSQQDKVDTDNQNTPAELAAGTSHKDQTIAENKKVSVAGLPAKTSYQDLTVVENKNKLADLATKASYKDQAALGNKKGQTKVAPGIYQDKTATENNNNQVELAVQTLNNGPALASSKKKLTQLTAQTSNQAQSGTAPNQNNIPSEIAVVGPQQKFIAAVNKNKLAELAAEISHQKNKALANQRKNVGSREVNKLNEEKLKSIEAHADKIEKDWSRVMQQFVAYNRVYGRKLPAVHKELLLQRRIQDNIQKQIKRLKENPSVLTDQDIKNIRSSLKRVKRELDEMNERFNQQFNELIKPHGRQIKKRHRQDLLSQHPHLSKDIDTNKKQPKRVEKQTANGKTAATTDNKTEQRRSVESSQSELSKMPALKTDEKGVKFRRNYSLLGAVFILGLILGSFGAVAVHMFGYKLNSRSSSAPASKDTKPNQHQSMWLPKVLDYDMSTESGLEVSDEDGEDEVSKVTAVPFVPNKIPVGSQV